MLNVQVSDVMEWMEENVKASSADLIMKKKQLREAVQASVDKIQPPPPPMSINENIYSPSGALIEFID